MDLDTGAARIKTGSRVGGTVHLVRPPVGQGLVCDPKIGIDRLVADDGPVTCKVCLSNKDKEN
jgi:hypothetical protein